MKTLDNWQGKFRYYVMRTHFQLALSRPMLEFLCAVADNVWWDRALYRDGGGVASPDNFLASSSALEKRGLIRRASPSLLEREKRRRKTNVYEFRSGWLLTPAGKIVVELLKQTGLFVEHDTAIQRKAAVHYMKRGR